MKRIPALPCITCVLLAFLTGCSDAPLTPEQPPRATLVQQTDGLYCTEPNATLSSGALYQVCVEPSQWNGDVVVFIPGYHDPARAPRLPDLFGNSDALRLFTGLGYAFATTSFRGTGLIERDTWVGGDLLELVRTAKELLMTTTGRGSRFVYQTGGSQGGLGTVMAVERYPGTFHGGLAACGPIGDYRRQIAYVADFRVVFDHFFGPAIVDWPVWRQNLPDDPGYIDPESWHIAGPSSGTALDDPANGPLIDQVLSVTRAPTDPANSATIKETALGLLWYSFRGTNDAIAKLGGMPFGNIDRQYTGSSDDNALNAGVARFQLTADPALLAKLQTAARLQRPLVTMHTTGDPIVPVSQQSLYRSRLSFFSRLRHTQFTIKRYGHCNFTEAEVLAAFAVLVLQVSGTNLFATSTVLPEPQAQSEFLRLARQHGADPVLVGVERR